MSKTNILKRTRYIRTFFLFLLLPVVVFYANTRTGFFYKAALNITGKKADIVVNLQSSSNKEAPWGYYAQGGEERGGMLKNIIPQVKVLKPKYIRIDHIYDFFNVVDKNDMGELIFNWEKLDLEIADILATGAKPFIALSYMPSSISTGTEVDLPTKWEEWEQVVRKTVEHISGKEELNISDVYYEVWNEPDLFGQFKMGASKDYLGLYRYAVRGAENAQNVNSYKIGGPATTALYKNWFDRLLAFAENNNLKFDFFSWHKYSKNLNDFENDIQNVFYWLEKYPRFSNLELIISESGFNSENDPGYDNNLSAIHALSLYAQAAAQDVELKIFTFEIKDGPGESRLWKRWGLITHENFGSPILKPRYKAMEFLNKMNGEFFPVYGQGTWVKAFATKDGDTIKLLLVNYDQYGEHYENVPVLFSGLSNDKLSVRRIDFLEETIEYPEEEITNIWNTNVLMAPNSATILELKVKE